MNAILIFCIGSIYLLIGGIIHGLLYGDEKEEYAGVFFWPLVIIIWIGDEIGKKIKKIFNIKS